MPTISEASTPSRKVRMKACSIYTVPAILKMNCNFNIKDSLANGSSQSAAAQWRVIGITRLEWALEWLRCAEKEGEIYLQRAAAWWTWRNAFGVKGKHQPLASVLLDPQRITSPYHEQ